jgi:hypothetical protein
VCAVLAVLAVFAGLECRTFLSSCVWCCAVLALFAVLGCIKRTDNRG